MTRYGLRLGCRFGQSHDFEALADNNEFKIERCQICGIRKKWNKGYKGTINNKEYIKLHVRNFAQPDGITKRVFLEMNEPEKLIIHI